MRNRWKPIRTKYSSKYINSYSAWPDITFLIKFTSFKENIDFYFFYVRLSNDRRTPQLGSNFALFRFHHCAAPDQKGPFTVSLHPTSFHVLPHYCKTFLWLSRSPSGGWPDNGCQTTFSVTQWGGNKDVASNPSRDVGPPCFAVADGPVNYSKTPLKVRICNSSDQTLLTARGG